MTLSEVEIESPNLNMSFTNDLQVSSVTPNLTPSNFGAWTSEKEGIFPLRSQSAAFQVVEVRHLGISISGMICWFLLQLIWKEMSLYTCTDTISSSNWSTASEMPKWIFLVSQHMLEWRRQRVWWKGSFSKIWWSFLQNRDIDWFHQALRLDSCRQSCRKKIALPRTCSMMSRSGPTGSTGAWCRPKRRCHLGEVWLMTKSWMWGLKQPTHCTLSSEPEP